MVEFAELAEKGLGKAFEVRTDAWRASIQLHLGLAEAVSRSFVIKTELNAELYLLPLGQARVLWELRPGGEKIVWSVTKAKKEVHTGGD
jgi:hypothetical protein